MEKPLTENAAEKTRSLHDLPVFIRRLIARGDLEAMTGYIRDEHPLRIKFGVAKRLKSALEFAVETGFYSMVKLLLNEAIWSEEELEASLQYVMWKNREDLVHLLLEHGAPTENISSHAIFRTMNMGIFNEFLERGFEPCEDNAFARILNEVKAKPLLRFYKSHHENIPELKEQICKALVMAVDQHNVRWIALLVWAGADLDLKVEVPIYGFDDKCDETYSITGFDALVGLGDIHLLEALKIPVTTEIINRLLRNAAYKPEDKSFKTLMKKSTEDDLNSGERGGCVPLEEIVDEHSHDLSAHLYGYDGKKEQEQTLRRTDLLLKAGAKWLPSHKTIQDTRRSLISHDSKYLVRLLRMMIYTPEAATIDDIWELCRTPTIRAKIKEGDSRLWDEICGMAATAGFRGAAMIRNRSR